jgi:hypothetical protein
MGHEPRTRLVRRVAQLDFERVHAGTDRVQPTGVRLLGSVEPYRDGAGSGRVRGEEGDGNLEQVERPAELVAVRALLELAEIINGRMDDEGQIEPRFCTFDSKLKVDQPADRRPRVLSDERDPGFRTRVRRPGEREHRRREPEQNRPDRPAPAAHRSRSSTQSPTGRRRNPHES